MGQVVMTNGPFLEVLTRSSDAEAIAGGDLTTSGVPASLLVRARCPNRLNVDRVQVFLNGRLAEGLNFTGRRRRTPSPTAP